MKSFLGVLLVGSALVVQAADYLIVGETSSGSGELSGGPYAIRGGLSDVTVAVSSAGPYSIRGVVSAVISVIPTPGAPLLTVRLVNGQVLLSWMDPAQQFTLEGTGTLASPAAWTPVNAPPEFQAGLITVNLGAPSGTRYLRLRLR